MKPFIEIRGNIIAVASIELVTPPVSGDKATITLTSGRALDISASEYSRLKVFLGTHCQQLD